MLQRVTVRRTETITLELEVLQPLSQETLAHWANSGGLSQPMGAPAPGKSLSHVTTLWTVQKAEPSCECARVAGKKRKGR